MSIVFGLLILLPLAVILSSVVAYFMAQAAIAYTDEALDEHEEVQEDLFAFCDNDLDELEARIEALEARAQAQTSGRPPGIYNEYGQQVFGAVENPFGADSGGIIPVEQEIAAGSPYMALSEDAQALVDQMVTHDLDGTEGNEPEDE